MSTGIVFDKINYLVFALMKCNNIPLPRDPGDTFTILKYYYILSSVFERYGLMKLLFLLYFILRLVC